MIKIGVSKLNQGPGPSCSLRSILETLRLVEGHAKAEPVLRKRKLRHKYLSHAATSPGGPPSTYARRAPVEPGSPHSRQSKQAGKDAQPAWAWDKVSGGPLVGMVNLDVLGKILDAELGRTPAAMMATIAPLWQNTRMVVAGVSMDKTLTIHAIAETPSNEAGKKMTKNLQAVATLGENLLDGLSRSLEQAPAAEKAAAGQLIAIGKELLGHLEIKEQGNFVDLQTQSDKFGPHTVATIVLPAIFKARLDAQRTVSTNNLKQIAQAMHTTMRPGHFPAAVVMGPDGKTPHSWRGDSSFLEQNELFKAYKMDEPWDSPNNRRCWRRCHVFTMRLRPAVDHVVVLCALEDRHGLPGERGTITDITDGTSIPLAVEADPAFRGRNRKTWNTTRNRCPSSAATSEANAALCDGSVLHRKLYRRTDHASVDHTEWWEIIQVKRT